jgi:hypothetical protein
MREELALELRRLEQAAIDDAELSAPPRKSGRVI